MAGVGASLQEAQDPDVIGGGFRPGHFVVPAIAAGLGYLSPALAIGVTAIAAGLGGLGAFQTMKEWD